MKGLTGAGLGLVALGGYAFGYEPRYALNVTPYDIYLRKWPKNTTMKIALVADIHAGGYNMPLKRVEEIVRATNALKPDLSLYLGDTLAGYRNFGVAHDVDFDDVAGVLKNLKAPLGVYGVLGNHDWWDDPEAQRRLAGPTLGHKAFNGVGVKILENDALKLTHKDASFWLAGLGDQLAFPRFRARQKGIRSGVDDLPLVISKIKDNAPVILMAHEPKIFGRMVSRVGLTLCGHTHGGQVNLFGWRPTQMVPRYASEYMYGHYEEEGKQLIVSGGLGCSHMPVRLGMPPEITVINVRGLG